jgi:hypothetical protein
MTPNSAAGAGAAIEWIRRHLFGLVSHCSAGSCRESLKVTKGARVNPLGGEGFYTLGREADQADVSAPRIRFELSIGKAWGNRRGVIARWGGWHREPSTRWNPISSQSANKPGWGGAIGWPQNRGKWPSRASRNSKAQESPHVKGGTTCG